MLLCFHDIHSKFQKSCHCSIFETKGYHTMPNNSPFIIGEIQPRVTISVIAISNSIIVTPNSKYSGPFNIGVHGKWLMRDKF